MAFDTGSILISPTKSVVVRWLKNFLIATMAVEFDYYIIYIFSKDIKALFRYVLIMTYFKWGNQLEWSN